MSLETTLTDIITRLRQGRFQNEQAVSQGIVLPAAPSETPGRRKQ